MSDTPTRSQRAIETTGAVDEAGRLHLDEPLDGAASRAVRVLVLFDVMTKRWASRRDCVQPAETRRLNS